MLAAYLAILEAWSLTPVSYVVPHVECRQIPAAPAGRFLWRV
jgi:hypothetical protein